MNRLPQEVRDALTLVRQYEVDFPVCMDLLTPAVRAFFQAGAPWPIPMTDADVSGHPDCPECHGTGEVAVKFSFGVQMQDCACTWEEV